MSSIRPYYRRRRRTTTVGQGVLATGSYVDLRSIRPPEFAAADPVRPLAAQFDDRAAAVIAAAVAVRDLDDDGKPKLRVKPPITWNTAGPYPVPEDGQPYFEQTRDVTEFKFDALGTLGRYQLRGKALAIAAYADFFAAPDVDLSKLLDDAILLADSGYCGTYGRRPTTDKQLALGDTTTADYDMGQTALVMLAYGYFDDLTPPAREHLIKRLLGEGIVHRLNKNLAYSSGPVPKHWWSAAEIGAINADIGETENHILMMLSNRYLTNQLLWQRTHMDHYDNRRNAAYGSPSCYELVLELLHRMVKGDFSEYNAKNYQEETRHALLNLHAYAYDHAVRLAAGMVLDYLAARMAVSSSDLRRMVPFRRRYEGGNAAHDADGFMSVPLLSTPGADPMGAYYAVQAGTTRSCVARPDAFRVEWGIIGGRQDLAQEALSEYRLPPVVHDLFANDRHRRFFQRLHRRPVPGESGGHRNADVTEINAASPSYLITAGGEPSDFAIDPRVFGFMLTDQTQQRGVAVTTSLIPTTGFGGSNELIDNARQVIQLGAFSDGITTYGRNYGVAPDFACGHQIRLPSWAKNPRQVGNFRFFDCSGGPERVGRSPGFLLAVLEINGFAALEALDTWLHPQVTIDAFQAKVLQHNANVQFPNHTPATWRTYGGSVVSFEIWTEMVGVRLEWGARVLSVQYGGANPQDAAGDAATPGPHLHNGGVLNSLGPAHVRIANPFQPGALLLDLRDKFHPRRTAEDGTIETAGAAELVWADFEWTGSSAGDACRPVKSRLAAAVAGAPGGSIRIVPSVSLDRTRIGIPGKGFRLEAPIGQVRIGG
jgi:hypothetical protein